MVVFCTQVVLNFERIMEFGGVNEDRVTLKFGCDEAYSDADFSTK